MEHSVELVWIGDRTDPPLWRLGKVWAVDPSPDKVLEIVQQNLNETAATAWLFWDEKLGKPDETRIEEALSSRGELWHAGLRLGMSGLPGMIDFVKHTWMLNADPHPMKEATSWRLTLKACLIRSSVLQRIGFIRPGFKSLEAASLELGHRYVSRGVITRNSPWLISNESALPQSELSLEDEVRILFYRFGARWTHWALWRAFWTGYAPGSRILGAWRELKRLENYPVPIPFHSDREPPETEAEKPNVTVLIPTLERYPYLKTVLSQLRLQTIPPLEIIVVDQTPKSERDLTLENEFQDLPVRFVYLDKAGQCSSRNVGLQMARGQYILFLDDDDEVSPSLIELHLRSLRKFQADVSSGIANEVGAGSLPESFTYARVSDVFPTNNTLIHHSVLAQSGLFDLAYEKGQRADGDLGMRVYLSGALMVLNPDIAVLHHHAPSGGLRKHKARVITYASSRMRLAHRHLPSATEIYLAKRYFSKRQVKEMLWMRILGTFSAQGGTLRKMLKVVMGLLFLPNTILQIRKREREAEAMLQTFPQIPVRDERIALEGIL